MSPLTWTAGTLEDVVKIGMKKYQDDLYAAILEMLEGMQDEIVAWMQENAPWTDDTGDARAALHVEIIGMTDYLTVIFAHGVEYGMYLEMAYAGKNAILGPTLDVWSPIILERLRALLGNS